MPYVLGTKHFWLCPCEFWRRHNPKPLECKTILQIDLTKIKPVSKKSTKPRQRPPTLYCAEVFEVFETPINALSRLCAIFSKAATVLLEGTFRSKALTRERTS